MPSGFSKDQQGFVELASQWAAGFSDDDTTLGDLLGAEDGKVVTRFSTRATHTGEVFGVSPGNRSLTFTAIEIYSVVDGKVTDWWAEITMDVLFNPSE
jgi:predicted ester cyclase